MTQLHMNIKTFRSIPTIFQSWALVEGSAPQKASCHSTLLTDASLITALVYSCPVWFLRVFIRHNYLNPFKTMSGVSKTALTSVSEESIIVMETGRSASV